MSLQFLKKIILHLQDNILRKLCVHPSSYVREQENGPSFIYFMNSYPPTQFKGHKIVRPSTQSTKPFMENFLNVCFCDSKISVVLKSLQFRILLSYTSFTKICSKKKRPKNLKTPLPQHFPGPLSSMFKYQQLQLFEKKGRFIHAFALSSSNLQSFSGFWGQDLHKSPLLKMLLFL